MDLGSLLLGLALIIVVAAFVARPLLERPQLSEAAPGPADELLAEREQVLTALRDLDFDHATGKIEADDYQAQRAVLVGRGVEVLRLLDSLGVDTAPAERLDEEIEAAVAARRRKPQAAPAPACPSCGKPYTAEDAFCSRCGARLRAEAPAR